MQLIANDKTAGKDSKHFFTPVVKMNTDPWIWKWFTIKLKGEIYAYFPSCWELVVTLLHAH